MHRSRKSSLYGSGLGAGARALSELKFYPSVAHEIFKRFSPILWKRLKLAKSMEIGNYSARKGGRVPQASRPRSSSMKGVSEGTGRFGFSI